MILRNVWYQRMPGLMAVAAEKKVLSCLLRAGQRDVVLQIGGPDDARMLDVVQSSRIVFLDAQCRVHHEKPYIQAELTQLPIASDSVDTILLLHALEVSADVQKTVAEVHRILKPEGKVIVCCFNRWSLWNLFHILGRRKVFPKVNRCYSLRRIKNYLRSLGMKIETEQTVCFRPPVDNQSKAKRWLFLETLGQMLAPYFGAVVMVSATKKVLRVTPLISMEWIKKMAVSQSDMIQPQPSSSRGYSSVSHDE